MASSHEFGKHYKTQGRWIERKPDQGSEIQRQRENCRINQKEKEISLSKEQQYDWQLDFSLGMMKVKRQENHIFKVLKQHMLLK